MTERPLSTLLPQLWWGMAHAVSAVSMSSLVVLTQNSDLLLKVRPQQIGCNLVFVFFQWLFAFLMPNVLLKLIIQRLWFMVLNILSLFESQIFHADPCFAFFFCALLGSIEQPTLQTFLRCRLLSFSFVCMSRRIVFFPCCGKTFLSTATGG